MPPEVKVQINVTEAPQELFVGISLCDVPVTN